MPTTRVRRGLYWSDRTRTWHYEFRFHGVKKNGDTGHSHEKLAREWLAAFKGRLADAEVGLAPAGPAPTLQKALGQWIAEHGPRVGARHRAITKESIEHHLAGHLATPLSMLTTPVVNRAIADYLAGQGHSEGGANVVLRSLKLVVRYALKAGRLPAMPFDVQAIKVQERPRRAMTAADVGRLLAQLEEIHAPIQALDQTRLMAGLGLRVSEACLARVEALDLRRREFTPWDPEAGTKGHEAVALPVPKWLVPHLQRMAGDRTEGYLIQGARKESPSRQVAWSWIAKARVKLHWPWLTPHELRAAYATMLSEEGLSTKAIQGLLRHKDPRTTDRYLRRDLSHAREALDRIGKAAGLAPPEPKQSPTSPRKRKNNKLKQAI